MNCAENDEEKRAFSARRDLVLSITGEYPDPSAVLLLSKS